MGGWGHGDLSLCGVSMFLLSGSGGMQHESTNLGSKVQHAAQISTSSVFRNSAWGNEINNITGRWWSNWIRIKKNNNNKRFFHILTSSKSYLKMTRFGHSHDWEISMGFFLKSSWAYFLEISDCILLWLNCLTNPSKLNHRLYSFFCLTIIIITNTFTCPYFVDGCVFSVIIKKILLVYTVVDITDLKLRNIFRFT